MRNIIHNPKAEFLKYGIREVVELAQKLGELDPNFQFIGENIGDPVAKGWEIPGFVRDVLCDLIRTKNHEVFGYAHSRGQLAARRWVAEYARSFSPSSKVDAEHVVFANGLGAGISIFYRMLAPGARVIQPNPGYPAHISTERFYAGAESIGYRLDPTNRWHPDLDHLERQIKRHPEIVGILLINPNNPTGEVYDREMLEAVIRLAEKSRLMLIVDEVYFRLVFNGSRFVHATELAAGRVPLIVMRGVSKDVPWPGARCGWMEFHNTELDEDFNNFFESVKKPLMLEVCATALPQAAAPLIYAHPEYPAWLARYVSELERNANAIADTLGRTPGISIERIHGAFYLTALFEEGALNHRQTLPIAAPAVDAFIREAVSDEFMPLDKRFAYYLLASTGICVVPASDFDSPFFGFRVTALERDPVRLTRIYQTLSSAIERYLASA